jgi:predicted DsbA family dithiol-disulfide isomerase
VKPVHLVVYSDYLCPWCYNASVRLKLLREELGDRVRVEWKSFLLRPDPREARDLERFRRYTRSWLTPAAESDSGTFQVWEGTEGPPSHSIPPHRVAKAAATFGEEAFERVHDRLLHAYFAENRNITSEETLGEIWAEAGLPPGELKRAQEPAVLDQILREYREAFDVGATGVPAVRRADQDVAVTGAFPVEFYRRWVERALKEREESVDPRAPTLKEDAC